MFGKSKIGVFQKVKARPESESLRQLPSEKLTSPVEDILSSSSNVTRKRLFDICQDPNLSVTKQYTMANAANFIESINSPLDVNGNRLLHLTTAQNDYTMTALLLQKGADPNVLNNSGISPTMIAKRMGYIKATKLLCQYGGIIPFKEENRTAETSALVSNGTVAQDSIFDSIKVKGETDQEFTSKVLLPLPSNSAIVTPQGLFTANNEKQDTRPSSAARSRPGDEGMEESRRIGFQRNIESKIFSISDASYLGFMDPLSKTISKSNVDAPDSNGSTPLMKAAFRGQTDIVELLLESGADVNKTDNNGHTALVWGTLGRQLTAVKILCDNGSLIDGAISSDSSNISSRTGQSAMMSCTYRITPLIAAVHVGHYEIFEYLLSRGANVNLRVGSGKGKSALMIACCLKKVNFAQTLLKCGAIVDPDYDQWLPRGVILMKKLAQTHNPWLGPLSDAPNRKRDIVCLQTKPSLQDKLLYLTPEENEVITQMSHMLAGTWQAPQKPTEMDAKRTSEQISQPYKTRPNNGRRRNNTFRQGLNLEKLLGNNSDQILRLAERMPDSGTELDELWIAMFKCVVQLVMAANKNIKHHYIAISAKAVHSASEIVRAVEGIDGNSTKVSPSKALGKANDQSWFLESPVRLKVKELSNIISTVFPKQLMVSTRMAIGVWPPPDALSSMIREATNMAAACHELVLLANTLGHYPVLDKNFELSFDAFEERETNEQQQNLSLTDGREGGDRRPKGGLNYNEYKRQNDLKLIEDISKKYDVGNQQQHNASQDGLNVTEEKAADIEFFKSLDERLKQFVGSVAELKQLHDQHLKEDFANATSIVYEKADMIMEEVRNFEILAEYPDDLMFHMDDISRFESLGIRFATPSFPCQAKPLYLSALEDVKNAATHLTVKGKIAGDAWPPQNSAAEMLQATIPCVLAVKKLVLIAKESATKIRQTHSDERRKKDMWKKECLQNQRVKHLFQMWESQVLGEQNPVVSNRSTAELVTVDEFKLFEESTEGYVGEESNNGRKIIRGGRLAKLVEIATSHISSDDEFMAALIMTHHSFTTSNELLDQLFKRYDISPPYGLNQSLFELYVDKKIVPVRLRVCATLQHWIVNHFEEDFMDYESLILRYKDFVEKKVAVDFENTSISMLETLNKKLMEDNRGRVIPQLSPEKDRACPKPILPVPRFGNDPLQTLALDPKNLFEFDPLEIARQLTLIEFSLFTRVKAYECLDQIWDGQRRKEAMIMKPSPNPKRHVPGSPSSDISKLINHTNTLTFWIATMILKNEALKTRTAVLKFFVSLALHCKELNNLTGVTTIVGALSMAPISRLHRTWQAFEDKYPKLHEYYKELADIVSPKFQYANYRKVLKEMSPPAIPFLGVYLTDLTFIELGNPDFLPDSHFINFEKRRKVYNLIQEIQRYQQVPFPIIPVPQIQELLNRICQNLPRSKRDEDMQIMNDDELYNQSLTVEPKEVTNEEDD